MPEIDQTVSELFTREGTPLNLRLNESFLIAGSTSVWLVQSGQVELFVVQVEGWEIAGARSHFLSLGPGSLIFGMDFEAYGQGSAFLLIGAEGTQLIHLTVSQLQALARRREHTGTVARLIDDWLTALSFSVVRDVRPRPKADEILVGGRQTELAKGKIARAKSGIVWIQVMRGEALFVGMEGVSLSGEGTVPILPLSPDTWIESYDENLLHCFSTPTVLTQAMFWRGINLFHEVLCRCEFINKRLRLVDEFNRLRARETFGVRSREIALREIVSVLEPSRLQRGPAFGLELTADPLVAACRLVGDSLGITIRTPPDLHRVNDKLAAIAKASRFRYRVVALRDNWWETDHGPLLAYRDAKHEPVAILKVDAGVYELVDPQNGERTRVTPAIAATLSPFAGSFYRPLPERSLSAWDLIKFGIRESRSDLWTILTVGVLVGLLGMITPYFTGQIFDSVIPEAERNQLLQFTVGLIAAALGTFAFELVRAIAVLRLTGTMDYSVQSGVWDRLLNLPSTFFRNYSAGDLSDRAMGVEQIRQAISQSGTQALVGSISALVTALFLFIYNLKMAVVAVGLLLGGLIVPLSINFLQLKYQRRVFRIRGVIAGLVLQLINGVSKLRVAGAEDRAFREWAHRFAEQRRIAFAAGQLANAVQIFIQVYPVIGTAVVFGAYGFFQNQAALDGEKFGMTTGQFVAFNGLFLNVLSGMMALSGVALDLMGIFPLFERLKPIIQAAPEIDEAKAHPGELNGEIEVAHLSFRYDKEGPLILKDLSLHVRPGEFVALVGGSGSGKSTLIRLLLGFEKPESGSIYYDGQDLQAVDVRELRQQIGVVLQSSKLMPTDIYRNIIGSHTQLSINDAWEAARMAGLDRDIKNMPMGMHTVVSEAGSTFSGGQRQRLMIARAIVNRPRIIFFDEATSALDNETQRIVTESLDAMQATRLVIAHRLSTIINANRIFVLHSGEMVQSGTYAELVKQPGPFAELAQRQLA